MPPPKHEPEVTEEAKSSSVKKNKEKPQTVSVITQGRKVPKS